MSGYISCFVCVCVWEIVRVILRMEAGCCDVFCVQLFSSHVRGLLEKYPTFFFMRTPDGLKSSALA